MAHNVFCDSYHVYNVTYIGCPTTYQTRQFFNNSKTNEDIATGFEQEYVRCVRNKKECVCSEPSCSCNILISGKIIKELPGLVGSGTPVSITLLYLYCRRSNTTTTDITTRNPNSEQRSQEIAR